MKQGLNKIALATMLVLVGCAGAEVSEERKALPEKAFTKTDLIIINKFKVDQMVIHGDAAANEEKTREEKAILERELNQEIARVLSKEGYRALSETDAMNNKPAVTVEGEVTAFDHGSAAGRFFAGMYGAGKSKMHMKVRLKNAAGETIAEFKVTASSGNRGGGLALASFLNEHMEDAGKAITEYFNEKL